MAFLLKRKAFRISTLVIGCGSLWLLTPLNGYAQAGNELDKITIRSTPAGGVVSMLDCENGFGGGNVAASIGPDGILLVDDMYKAITPRLLEALKKSSHADVRIVVNTHFHGDHIQGNSVVSPTSIIIAQENVLKRLRSKAGGSPVEALPHVTFRDSLILRFNGEDIRLLHLPNGHTDNDVYVYFPSSGVIHMGDTYFNGMFPAVYKEGGGDVLQLIVNLERIFAILPEGTKVIPGHGDLAKRADLLRYVSMLKETTSIVQTAIRNGKPLEQLKAEKPFAKYDSLGQGGAQTTDQYLAMLYKLLSP